ncbi:MAG TPA: LysE family translocator [Acidimicrobiales bacterium]|nr:LysE family translocator [Acidimicrobiales bacterium]
MLTSFATFLVASAVIVVFPGPDTLVVLRALLSGGRRQAARTAAGVLTGLATWVCAAALGLSALLAASHAASLALRIVGGAYLVLIGLRSLLASRRRVETGVVAAAGELVAAGRASPRRGLLGTGYRAGLVTDLLNPKVGVFFVTFLPGFVPRGEPVGLVSVALGAVFVLETAAYFAVIVLASDRVTRLMTSRRARRRIDRLSGVVLVGFGVRLALEG